MATQAESRIAARRIHYEASVWREDDEYVARAWPLDVVTSGKNEEHALEMLQEAVALFIEVSNEQGMLATILEETGYRLEDGVLTPPTVVHFSVSTSLKT